VFFVVQGFSFMTKIRFDHIAKSFGATTVVKGLDLTIEEGEFFTFVGPSGCGKSTILNIIAGLEAPTGGGLYFDDRLVNALSPKDRDAAMVFQSYALYPHLTVFENIAFPLRLRKERNDTIKSEVERIAGFLGLSDFLGKKPKELSGGQRQRVALGRAIIRKPKVFLMDEPLSNLDARLRVEMRGELRKLHQDLGITTVYVTHDQSEAMSLSDRIAVLNKGEIQQCDAPAVVYRDPASTFVAGFIGSPAMNFMRCPVRGRDPLIVDCGDGPLDFPGRTADGSEVLVGIRPEDAVVHAGRVDGGREVTVSVIEPAGPIDWVEVLWAGKRFTARADVDEQLKPGSRAYLSFSKEKLSLFDAVSEKKIR
jgi:multiple sugar transport system ATP-binding protein